MFSFFLLIIFKSVLLAEIRWSVCKLKSHKSLCVAFSRTRAGLCIYHLLVWSNLNFLHISQWITLPTQSCLAFYSLSYYYYYYYYYFLRVFHISDSWWSFSVRSKIIKTAPSAPITTGTTLTLVCNSFF